LFVRVVVIGLRRCIWAVYVSAGTAWGADQGVGSDMLRLSEMWMIVKSAQDCLVNFCEPDRSRNGWALKVPFVSSCLPLAWVSTLSCVVTSCTRVKQHFIRDGKCDYLEKVGLDVWDCIGI